MAIIFSIMLESMLKIRKFLLLFAWIGFVFINFANLQIYKGKSAIVPQLVPTVSCPGLLKQQLIKCPVIIPP